MGSLLPCAPALPPSPTQLLEAVAFLHEHWIVHRDIKLSNLLYTHTGHLKLCDFGLARWASRSAGVCLVSEVTPAPARPVPVALPLGGPSVPLSSIRRAGTSRPLWRP